MIGADLKRWGLTATLIAAVFFAAGYFTRINGPLSREAQMRHDSAKVADAAFDRGEREATMRHQHLEDSLWAANVRLSALYAGAQQRTDSSGATVQASAQRAHTVIQRVLVEVQDTASHRALLDADAAVGQLQADVAKNHDDLINERQRADSTIRNLQAGWHADSLESGRLAAALTKAQGDRDAAESREQQLIKQQGDWKLVLSLGPGVSFDGHVVRGAPVQASVGLAHEIHFSLRKLLPHL